MEDDQKLVLFIDNIDRCSSDQLSQILKDLTTFFQHRKIISIVPCDIEAVRRHYEKNLTQPGNQKNDEGNDFLKKVFNGFVEIPKLEAEEVNKYAAEGVEDIHKILSNLSKIQEKTGANNDTTTTETT